MNRYLANLLIFVLAIALYAIGFGYGAVAVIVLAVIAELVFWVRLFYGIHGRKKEDKQLNSTP